MTNEFKGATLQEAVRQATAAYRRPHPFEHKDVCSDLAVELSDFKRAGFGSVYFVRI